MTTLPKPSKIGFMHPTQSPQWGEFRKKTGNLVSVVNGLQIIWSKIPRTPWYFGTLSKSRMPSNKDIKRLRNEGIKLGGIGIRIEPEVLKNKALSAQRSALNKLVAGRKFYTPQTYWLDLTKSEDELLATMHPKARYNIRLAEKKGVSIIEDNSDEAFAKYLELTEETARRQGFFAHDREYHQKMWDSMKEKVAHLFVAKYQGETLATWIIFKYDNKIYYPYGASSEKYREVMAPALMLWKTALWGKAQGCKTYDLWGGEEGKGFADFKKRFGPKFVEFVGTYDLVINPVLYWLFRVAEIIRWGLLKTVR